jgi:hypothetical protein
MSNYFDTHPQILMSPIRVLHYFDARYDPEAAAEYNVVFRQRLDELVKRKADADKIAVMRDRVAMIDDESAYLQYFRNRWSGEKVLADITPAYFKLGADAFQTMLRAHRKVRLIFVMRNPIDRFWSHVRLQRTRNPSVDVYALYDRRTRGGRKGVRDSEDFSKTIKTLDGVAPAGAVKYIFFENLFNPGAIEDLCRFLEVDYVPADIATPLNQSDPMPLDAERRGRGYQAFETEYRFVHDRFEGKLPKSWLDDIERFANSSGRAPA